MRGILFIVFGKKAFYAIFALLLVLTAATVSMLLPPEAVETSVSAPTGKTVWVIDAGHGAQVFYGKKEGSAEVANAVQLALNQTVNAGNEKTEKAIDASIFLMKNVTAPAILIECGFLSNENETALLKSGEYQQRLAVVIASGLLQQQ